MTLDLSRLRLLAAAATPGPWFFAYATVRKSLGDDEEYSVADMPRVAGDTETRQGGLDGEFIAACSPDVIEALCSEVERLRANRDHSCACSVNDGSAPLVKHDKDCPIRANARKRISPEVALARLGAAIDSGDENDELRQQLAAVTAARDDACEIAVAFIKPLRTSGRGSVLDRLAALRKVDS